MTDMKSLLIELGTEELPVKALPNLAQAFFDGVIAGLATRGIALDRGDAKPLYSPRRLAVLLPGVAGEQPEQTSEVLGPYLNIALDANDEPTKALQGFAQKAGVVWTQLERTTDNKGERFVHRAVKPGQSLRALLPEIVREAIASMPIPKPMRWGDHDYAFARPLHWLVLLHGDDVIDGEVFGIRSDRMSRGHRFMHDKAVWIGRAEDYVDALRGAKVLVDPDERRARIVREVEQAAAQANGTARIADDNLEQVNCLVEWPKAVLCSFDSEFLEVPQEALIATMETNQKFFPVLGDDGKLSEHFIGIANIESKDESEIRKGYERVIRPRFADAKFFFVEDMKQGLASMNEGLKRVTYQAKLGTVADKVARVAALSEAIAVEVGVDPKLARRAAELSKADLQSRLVNEFPELQGIAGRYYSAVEQEPLEVANAIDEGYMPRFAGDAIAPSKLGQVIAIAERLDTLAGGFVAGLKPTGNKDPFALRRNALGLSRTLIEASLPINIYYSISEARKAQSEPVVTEDSLAIETLEILGFILDRLRAYYMDQGVPVQQFEAVKASDPDTLSDFNLRVNAIGEFAKLPEAEALAAANKRIRNILRKAEGEIPSVVNASLFSESAERDLHDAVEQSIVDTDAALKNRDYVAVLGRLARLRPHVDAFFDGVMVNVDDMAVRNNRLALLKRLSDRLGSVAAIEHLSS
ncbi:MAG: glycine--tRNA ligase subunit beta [Pseudomonadota bacterium]|nr:glycine--tRNA ligase subunit beta [Pseudomonadota bacterium]